MKMMLLLFLDNVRSERELMCGSFRNDSMTCVSWAIVQTTRFRITAS